MKALKSLHLNSVKHLNLRTALCLAHECGFGGVEVSVPKLRNYLDAGHTPADVKAMLAQYGLEPVCVNGIFGVETMRHHHRGRHHRPCETQPPLVKKAHRQ